MIFQVFITRDCNLKCKYCFENDKQKENADIKSVPAMISFMKEYVKNDFITNKEIIVNFNGGEALLCKDFIIEAVAQFKNNGISNFSLSTNFMLLDEDFMKFLLINNFIVQISIDGKQKTHDLNRVDYNGNGSFDRVICNLERFKKLGATKNVVLSMVFTPQSVRDLSSNIKYLIKLGFNNIVTCFNDRESWNQRDIDKLRVEAKKIRKIYVKNFIKENPVYIKILSLDIENFLYGKSNCGICKDIIGILPNGDVIACGAFIGDYEKECKYKIGSIFEEELNLILINELLNWKCEYTECKECLFSSRCRNDCMACNYDSTGSINCPSATTCEINKIFIKESDKALLKLMNNETFKNYYLNFFKER